MTRRARRVVLDCRTTFALHVGAVLALDHRPWPLASLYMRQRVSWRLQEFDARRRGGEEEKG